MQLETINELEKNKKMHKYLYDNSVYYKILNRSPLNYQKFVNDMKEKYKLKTTDRINDAVEKIDLVNSILKVIND